MFVTPNLLCLGKLNSGRILCISWLTKEMEKLNISREIERQIILTYLPKYLNKI